MNPHCPAANQAPEAAWIPPVVVSKSQSSVQQAGSNATNSEIWAGLFTPRSAICRYLRCRIIGIAVLPL